MSNKHTPAPWHVVHNSWDMSTVYAADGSVVAQIPIGDLTCDEDQEKFEAVKDANAKLIEAAPDMYEVLTAIEAVILGGNQSDFELMFCVYSPIRDALYSAIAKATGAQV